MVFYKLDGLSVSVELYRLFFQLYSTGCFAESHVPDGRFTGFFQSCLNPLPAALIQNQDFMEDLVLLCELFCPLLLLSQVTQEWRPEKMGPKAFL